MKTKARSDSIRKRRNIEEKYSWDRISDSDSERKSHKSRGAVGGPIRSKISRDLSGFSNRLLETYCKRE